MQQVPIQTAHLFPKIDRLLIELLRSLSPEEWQSPTIAKKWTVKDIAAHLLDGNIRTLSLSRDQHRLRPNRPIDSYRDLVDYLNELNAEWVTAYKRVSHNLLIELLETTGKEFCSYIATLNPFDEAIFSVAWAGETVSKNWFHIAREYTEKFIHQQQIRDAVGKPGLIEKELFYPFIDTFMQALPYTYRNVEAKESTIVCVTVTSDAGGSWYLVKNHGQWILADNSSSAAHAEFSIDPDTAWRLFSKGITPSEAGKKVKLSGDEKLAMHAFQMISVMA